MVGDKHPLLQNTNFLKNRLYTTCSYKQKTDRIQTYIYLNQVFPLDLEFFGAAGELYLYHSDLNFFPKRKPAVQFAIDLPYKLLSSGKERFTTEKRL